MQTPVESLAAGSSRQIKEMAAAREEISSFVLAASPSEPKCFDSSDQLFDSPFVFAAGVSSQLLYLYDDHNGLDFLVDTGAAVSLFPHQSVQPCGPRRLRQADGSALPSWGRRNFKFLHKFYT